jgi:hypothetical protein
VAAAIVSATVWHSNVSISLARDFIACSLLSGTLVEGLAIICRIAIGIVGLGDVAITCIRNRVCRAVNSIIRIGLCGIFALIIGITAIGTSYQRQR